MGTNILLVESKKKSVKYIKKLVEGEPIPKLSDSSSLTPIKSIKAAANKIEENGYDVIIVDLDSLEGSGLGDLETLRAKNPRIPILVLVGSKEEGKGMEAVQRGAQNYLLKKNVNKNSLRNSLRCAIKLKERKKNGRLLNSLLEHIPDSIYFKDKDSRFVAVSKAKAEEVGETREEVVGKTDSDYFADEEAKQMIEDEKEVMETEEPVINKIEKITTVDGKDRWVSATKVPRYNEDGNVVGTLGISRDLTEHWVLWKRMKERAGRG